MAGVKRSRSVSAELPGDFTFVPQRVGRGGPRNAARKSLPAGYVNPDEALQQIFEDDSASSDESSKSYGRKNRPWTKIKRRLSPGRDLSPSPPIRDLPFENQDRFSTSDQATPQTLSLTFNLPRGHTGPFVVNLDVGSLLNSSSSSGSISKSCTSQENCPLPQSESSSELFGGSNGPATHKARCFLDLPPELRNMIYRQVLVTDTSINLRSPTNFCRSAAMLATCRQIHDEGTQILYGENTFVLDRQPAHRAAYFEKVWKEVAYKDCFRFLGTIGPINLSLIRKLHIICEDGSSRGNWLVDDHRFVNDDYLIQCLKLIANHGRLRSLKLSLHGKRKVKFTDYRFVDHLLAIKADEVKFERSRHLHVRWYYPRSYREDRTVNVEGELDAMMKAKIERKTKMY